MKDRDTFFRDLARRHPRTYWMIQSCLFYGLMALIHDIAATLAWFSPSPWPSRVLASILFAGAMLWFATHGKAASAPAE